MLFLSTLLTSSLLSLPFNSEFLSLSSGDKLMCTCTCTMYIMPFEPWYIHVHVHVHVHVGQRLHDIKTTWDCVRPTFYWTVTYMYIVPPEGYIVLTHVHAMYIVHVHV